MLFTLGALPKQVLITEKDAFKNTTEKRAIVIAYDDTLKLLLDSV